MKKIFLFLVYCFLFFACSPASFILTGTKRTPISAESVVFYDSRKLPENYEIVGKVSVQSASTLSRSTAHNSNLKKLKKKAASFGANGLIIDNMKNSNTAFDRYVSVDATAIYVNKQN